MKPASSSNGENPRVRVVPDEGKVFEADFVRQTVYGRSADFVGIDPEIVAELNDGNDEALERILDQDPENPASYSVAAKKVQLNCVDGVVRYIANRRIREVYGDISIGEA